MRSISVLYQGGLVEESDRGRERSGGMRVEGEVEVGVEGRVE